MTSTLPSPRVGAAPTTPRKARVESIDLLRGLAMILMALDHVRDYFHYSAYQFDPTDLSRTTVPIFLTRWITHFCAPVFVLLAGTAAYLYGQKKGIPALARFLFTRGLWLLFVEIVIVTLGWTFNLYFNYPILQVIWAIGVSMIVLSIVVRLPLSAIVVIGVVLVAGHNSLDGIHVPGTGTRAILWSFLHDQRFFPHFALGYPIIPWIGIMALGYTLGFWYGPAYDATRRRKNLAITGAGAIALFMLLRGINMYGDPHPWSIQKNPIFTALSFINVNKYPPSLDYVLLMLGPALVFLSITERRPLKGFGRAITVYGRVPMFYYLIHIFIIHALAIIGAIYCGYPARDMTMIQTWVTANPSLVGYGFNLRTVYLIWIVVVIGLYPLCRWYDRYKRTHTYWWLSYL
jgi:uncharacterized membrane protein